MGWVQVGGEVPLLRPRPLSGFVRFCRFLEEFGRDQVVEMFREHGADIGKTAGNTGPRVPSILRHLE
jgi:hypothetical protein